jgi:tetratricopeptide (TPR) repeat protein
VELAGAPKERVADALFNRGVAKGMLGDRRGASDDFTAVVELEGAPRERVAQALVNRGVASKALDRNVDAIADWSKVLDLEAGGDAVVGAAAANLFRLHWQDGSANQGNEALDRFAAFLAKQPSDQRAAKLTSFLAQLASPTLRQGWAQAASRLFEAQPPEAKQALTFLEPVCAILEGGGRHLLDPLPPEQREFALSVLSRFEPAERPLSS